MAILKFKKLVEDLQNNTTTVLPSMTYTNAGSAAYAGTSYKATSAGNAGTTYKASSADYAGTARIAHYGSSGTGAIAGTHAIFSTGL